MPDAVVVVYGSPGVGKSTLAEQLAEELALPTLAKDTIKEALWDALDRGEADDVAWSKELDGAAYEALWRLADAIGSRVLLDVPLDDALEPARIAALAEAPIEVFLWARPEVVHERREERQPERHPCHLPHLLPSPDEIRAMLDAASPLRLGGPLLEVDVSGETDVDVVVAWVGRHLSR